jgi:hypothetical protein
LEVFFLSGAFFYHLTQLLPIEILILQGALWPKIFSIGWP